MSTQQREDFDRFNRTAEKTGSTPDGMRAGFAELMAHFTPPEGVTTDTSLGGRHALRIEPTTAPTAGTNLYFHGAAFMLGSPRTALAAAANLVTRTGMTAGSADYRLAPENPYPGALDDAVAAYRDLLAARVVPAGIGWPGIRPAAGSRSSPHWWHATRACPHPRRSSLSPPCWI